MSDAKALAEALKAYGAKAGETVDDIRAGAQQLAGAVPPWMDEAASVAVPLMPGSGVLESTRLGADAGRLWREGNYGDALVSMGHAVDAPMSDVLWFLPGGSANKALTKAVMK